MSFTLIKYAAIVLLLIGSGFWVGQKFERGHWVDEIEDQRNKAEQAIQDAQDDHRRQIELTGATHARSIERFVTALAEAARQSELNQTIAARRREVIDELESRIENLRGEVSGRSELVLDPDDLRLLNEAVEAANATRAGMPSDSG